MKKLYLILLLGILMLNSCDSDFQMSDLPAEKILNGKDFTVHNGMIVFRDYETFKSISNVVAAKTDEELNTWEQSISFKSLRFIFNATIENEIQFVAAQLEKTSDVNLNRNTLGFLPETKKYLDSNILYLDELQTINMNVSDDYLGALVNKDGLLRIGDNIILFQRDLVKTLKVLDPSKIQLLYSAKQTDSYNNITVSEVERVVNFESRGAQGSKTQIIGSCESTVGNYRLYVYEEWTSVYPDVPSCTNGSLDTYKIKLRSLKKTLGIWNNYNTGSMRLTGSLIAKHEVDCDGGYDNLVTNTVLSNQPNYNYACAFGNTCYKYFWVNYDMAKCSIWVCGDPNQLLIFTSRINFESRSHTGYGYNNTSCYVGI